MRLFDKDSQQDVVLAEAVNSLNQLAFFGTPAINQPGAAGNTHTVAAGATTGVFTNTTFDGGTGTTAYTIGDIVLALKNLGLIAS